jgi:hypothetical protein
MYQKWRLHHRVSKQPDACPDGALREGGPPLAHHYRQWAVDVMPLQFLHPLEECWRATDEELNGALSHAFGNPPAQYAKTIRTVLGMPRDAFAEQLDQLRSTVTRGVSTASLDELLKRYDACKTEMKTHGHYEGRLTR